MGILDKLKAGVKSLADRVTGGYGKLTCTFKEPGDFRSGQRVALDVQIESLGELKVESVKLLFRGEELVSLDDEEGFEHFTCKSKEQTAHEDYELAAAFQLPQGESKTCSFELPLPAGLKPSFSGDNIRNLYHLQVKASIPWGVDLVENLSLNILPPAEPVRKHSFKQTSPFLTMGVDCDTPALGQPWPLRIHLSALRDLKVVRFSAKLVAVEIFQAAVKEMDPVTNKNFDEPTDGVPKTIEATEQPIVQREVERKAGTIELVEKLNFTLNGADRDYTFSSEAPLPEKVQYSYQTPKARRALRIELAVQTNSGNLKLTQELPVISA